MFHVADSINKQWHCCLLRNLSPVTSGWSYDVNVHGFCCHQWGGWGWQMLKSNKERFNNQPLKAGGSFAIGGLCP